MPSRQKVTLAGLNRSADSCNRWLQTYEVVRSGCSAGLSRHKIVVFSTVSIGRYFIHSFTFINSFTRYLFIHSYAGERQGINASYLDRALENCGRQQRLSKGVNAMMVAHRPQSKPGRRIMPRRTLLSAQLYTHQTTNDNSRASHTTTTMPLSAEVLLDERKFRCQDHGEMHGGDP